ncbi:MAG TPA: cyclopropane-fatty-acyl-phospholipid synthase family protein [Acidimicrobiia bacterium]|nr:cyclopropane-fatty-acyl-phospholipid synthase family protein [Acidimicrobiia bacterium]
MTTADLRSASPSFEVPRGPWQDLGAAPLHTPVHTAIARVLFHRVVPSLDVRVVMPDGRLIGGGGADAPLMRVRSDDFFRRLGSDGLIGFGEAFMAGDWDADDPAAVLTPFAARMDKLVPAWMQRLRRFYVRHQPKSERNTKTGARTNISRHYDLSNELFALFLDETMTYSSARFTTPDESLADGQRRKVDSLLDATGVGLGCRVLEIGTGWGALAERAAQRGATVTTVTLSAEQAAVARERVQRAGVAGRVDVQLRDYRDVEGRYDAILSVEMIEAVGHEYWATYFTTLDRALAPGGKIGVQAILLAHDRMLATLDQYTWISKYIFPGGALPSLRAIEDIVREHTGLHVGAVDAFGADYAHTLRAWRERFDAHAREVDALGFDATFRRMWDFYLAYCEAGFATGYLDVAQIVLTKDRLRARTVEASS